MTVFYKDHPRTDSIFLRGEVLFPNLTFETNNVSVEKKSLQSYNV